MTSSAACADPHTAGPRAAGPRWRRPASLCEPGHILGPPARYSALACPSSCGYRPGIFSAAFSLFRTISVWLCIVGGVLFGSQPRHNQRLSLGHPPTQTNSLPPSLVLAAAMPPRPPSSAADGRPFTSSGQRPQTQAGRPPYSQYDDGAGDYHTGPIAGAHGLSYGPQYTGFTGEYSLDEEDEDDESEPEDVFAYLPPTTAEQQQQHQLQPETPDFAHGYPPPPATASDPYAPPTSFYPPPSPHSPSSPFYHAPPTPREHPAAETPPSTGSRGSTDDHDPYRMRRLNTPDTRPTTANPAAVPTSARPSISRGSAMSNKEVHISLPTTGTGAVTMPMASTSLDKDRAEMEMDLTDIEKSSTHKHRTASLGDTASLAMTTPSMLESEGSIKYVSITLSSRLLAF
jgi:hypothetical protein